MDSSDDEADDVPHFVENFHFVDDKNEPITFCNLPICWTGDENPGSLERQIFLQGTADGGLQKIYKPVISWKFELLDKEPRISVLSKEKSWIKLQKPRKSYEPTIRTILITLNALHFLKRNPDTLGKPFWDRLRKNFSLHEVKPSEHDLIDHFALINDTVKHDETLSQSKFLLAFLQNPAKAKASNEHDVDTAVETKKSKFIVDDDEEWDEAIGNEDEDEDEDDQESDLFDSVCSICDNGGELLCCEGKCLRSFHATVHDGAESDCKSLGFSKSQVIVWAIQNFLCKNCESKQHQCYVCGILGSSEKENGAEVFSCVSALCGYFYHPECVSKLLYPENNAEAEAYKQKIFAGESFTCPAHQCSVCKERENKDVDEFNFAICRRCPKAYHRKCLPRRIAFEVSEDAEAVRAWDGLLPNNRILIYCLKHKIESYGTPKRIHIKFPYDEQSKTLEGQDLLSGKGKTLIKKRSVPSDHSTCETAFSKKPKLVEKVSFPVKDSNLAIKREKCLSEPRIRPSEKPKSMVAKNPLNSTKMEKHYIADERRATGRETGRETKLNLVVKDAEHVRKQKDIHSHRAENPQSAAPLKKKQTIRPPLDTETRERILTLKNRLSATITLEDVIRSHTVPSTHASSSKYVVDKSITQGKVDRFVEACRTALRMLEENGKLEEARAVCQPNVLATISKWRNKLKVYLAPFLVGLRYTSFGRHFTKVDKLQEIVDKLHPYVQNGDMIVDFCCGANDFSCLMKKKLEETGKQCNFKNFDMLSAKNDFNFERRDWMTVRRDELPAGSKLIMGLNPPFGVRASLANKFIDKALQFKPKLLILIVPPETERLDKKREAYDLIWEDNQKLSGKSFYLPGSVDVDDNQMEQWNLKPPLLYLWSRPDWTEKHKNIAYEEHHLSSEMPHELQTEEQLNEPHLRETDISPVHDFYGDTTKLMKEYADESNPIIDLHGQVGGPEPSKVGSDDNQSRTGHEDDLKFTERSYGDDPKVEAESKHGDGFKLNQALVRGDLRVDQIKLGDSDFNGSGDTSQNLKKKRFRENWKAEQAKSKQSRSNDKTPPRNRKEDVDRPSPVSKISSFKSTSLDFGTGVYGGLPTSSSICDEDLDDIERRYSSKEGCLFGKGSSSGPANISSLIQEYGGNEDRTSSFNRSSYPKEKDHHRYGRESDTGIQLLRRYGQQEVDNSELLRRYGQQEIDNSELLRRYGGPDPYSSRRSGGYVPPQDTGFTSMGSLPSCSTYGSIPGNTPSSSYGMMTTAMRRYGPFLDEFNHARPGVSFALDGPPGGVRNAMFDGPGSYPSGPPPHPGFHHDPFGFPPGPPHPFP
ncbi:protein ENHANCED DOWNY MILDEW 2-like isoform X1 [Papaver somniferum]|uniref:protein ENHANCED DOWNY MILDEW 2-like isoform X1 n=1 Tax=Papaver somniferum TaxID=3469 RepID=UPI000E6FB862|nr:protein ENHANCED DOWNY MILDEW 2-like isoform X1 [Papaver somniferum]